VTPRTAKKSRQQSGKFLWLIVLSDTHAGSPALLCSGDRNDFVTIPNSPTQMGIFSLPLSRRTPLPPS
jgi:hypothetical protein